MIWLAVTEAATAVILASGFIVLVGRNQIDLMTENAQLKSEQTALEMREKIEGISEKDPAGLVEKVSALEQQRSVQGLKSLVLYHGDGTILYPPGQGSAPPEDWKLVIKALGKRDFENKLFLPVTQTDSRIITLFVPYSSKSTEGSVLRFSFQFPDLDQNMELLFRQALIYGTLVLLIHLGLGLYAWWRIVRPLHQLITAVGEISQGNYSPALPRKRVDEIGLLTDAFEQMSVAVRDMQDKARAANPLSGLPGNVEIEHTVRDLLEKDISFAVLYCDLDNFKAYNDVYGFQKGDEAILYTRDCLLEAAQNNKDALTFVGHEGGDDFIVVAGFQQWEPLVKELLARFDRDVPSFYNQEHASQGYIETLDRKGNPARFPLLSLSVAVVINHHKQFEAFAEISRVAAELKKYAKGQTGSSYAVDRRGL